MEFETRDPPQPILPTPYTEESADSCPKHDTGGGKSNIEHIDYFCLLIWPWNKYASMSPNQLKFYLYVIRGL